MLSEIRQIALCFLATELDATGDLESWYDELRTEAPEKLLAWLVESPEGAERFYTMRADSKDSNLAILEAHDLKESDFPRLPFNQGTGARSPALGPIIKRTYSPKKIGPTTTTQNNTLKSFQTISASDQDWSGYFDEAHGCFSRGKLHHDGKIIDADSNAFATAVQVIDEKETVLLCFEDSQGRLPGEVSQYGKYLQNVLATTKYSTRDAPSVEDVTCSLCGRVGEVNPNAIRGAGINFANVDRDGAFAGMEVENAWKHLALCGGCADLIYVFSFHVADEFKTRIAGENALVIPSLPDDKNLKRKFMKKFKKWVKDAQTDKVGFHENLLLRLADSSDSILEITILWAEFGQRIDNVRGVLGQVLPSRLNELAQVNTKFNQHKHPAFPEHHVEGTEIDLTLRFLIDLLKRPGGKKAKKENEAKRLFDLRRDITKAVFHQSDITINGSFDTFMNEVLKTARWHLMDLFEGGHWEGLLYEGYSKRKQKAFLTFAGWVRQLAKALHYFRTIGVLPMSATDTIYQPELESLKPFFTDETAVDSDAKAYSFLLGVLYGKVMQVQAARGVNVGSNALTWLKRLTLEGKDLPELYVKVREKLLAYETEKSSAVRELVTEIGNLGTRVGDTEFAELKETDACYFLLLGQSLTTSILPTKKSENGDV